MTQYTMRNVLNMLHRHKPHSRLIHRGAFSYNLRINAFKYLAFKRYKNDVHLLIISSKSMHSFLNMYAGFAVCLQRTIVYVWNNQITYYICKNELNTSTLWILFLQYTYSAKYAWKRHIWAKVIHIHSAKTVWIYACILHLFNVLGHLVFHAY